MTTRFRTLYWNVRKGWKHDSVHCPGIKRGILQHDSVQSCYIARFPSITILIHGPLVIYEMKKRLRHPFHVTKIDRVPPLIINNIHVIGQTYCSLYRADKVSQIDCQGWHWPRDSKSIGFLLSSSTTNVKFKSDGRKLSSLELTRITGRVPPSSTTITMFEKDRKNNFR